VQPKAAGSSLLVKLTNAMALHALRIAGGGNKAFAESCLVLPLATGMAISLALLTLRQMRPESARYVLWPRMDQKSCLKSIQTAGEAPTLYPKECPRHPIWLSATSRVRASDHPECFGGR